MNELIHGFARKTPPNKEPIMKTASSSCRPRGGPSVFSSSRAPRLLAQSRRPCPPRRRAGAKSLQAQKPRSPKQPEPPKDGMKPRRSTSPSTPASPSSRIAAKLPGTSSKKGNQYHPLSRRGPPRSIRPAYTFRLADRIPPPRSRRQSYEFDIVHADKLLPENTSTRKITVHLKDGKPL